MLTAETTNAYLSILREELVPATGCTEPIALAYAAARLRVLLGAAPTRIEADISGNIIKNVKSVVVPNTGGRKGIAAAVAAGVVAGTPRGSCRSLRMCPPPSTPPSAHMPTPRPSTSAAPIPPAFWTSA